MACSLGLIRLKIMYRIQDNLRDVSIQDPIHLSQGIQDPIHQYKEIQCITISVDSSSV